LDYIIQNKIQISLRATCPNPFLADQQRETGFREMSVSGVGTIEAHLLEADFWPGKLPVDPRRPRDPRPLRFLIE
jgi:hypothetical protein